MKLHPTTKSLIEEIEAFCSDKRLSPTKFGKAALNDERFVHDLRRGRNPSPFTVDRVRAFMAGESVAA